MRERERAEEEKIVKKIFSSFFYYEKFSFLGFSNKVLGSARKFIFEIVNSCAPLFEMNWFVLIFIFKIQGEKSIGSDH